MIKQNNISLTEMGEYFRAGISSDTELYGVISSLSTPELEMPLKSSLVINKGTDFGEFSRAQSGLVSHFDIHGILRYSKSGIPRFAKEGLLFEGATANYISNTDFNNWDGVFTTTLNADISVDGTQNAMVMNKSILSFTTATSSAGYYTYSVWLKGALGGEIVALQMSTSSTQVVDGGASNSINVDMIADGGLASQLGETIIDATTSLPLVSTDINYIVEASQVMDGEIADIASPSTVLDGGIATSVSNIILDGETAGGTSIPIPVGILMKVITVTNKWERYSMTEYFGGGQPLKVILQSPSMASAFGPQLEKGTMLSTYIPTTGTVGTRGADILSIQGTNIPSVTSPKTMMLDFTPLFDATPTLRELIRTESSQYNIIRCLSNGEYTMYYRGGGLSLFKCEVGRTDRIAYVQSGGITSTIKAYINNEYVNEVTESVLTDVPTTTITIGNGSSGIHSAWGYIKNVRIFSEELNHQSLLLS